jgi:hypothetical protein
MKVLGKDALLFGSCAFNCLFFQLHITVGASPSSCHINISTPPVHLIQPAQDVSNRIAEDGAKNGKAGAVQKRVASTNASTRSNVNIAVDNREDVEVSESTNGNGGFAMISQPSINNMEEDNTLSYQYSGQPDDIDERDSDDPLCATSYVQDMYEHFRGKEVFTSVRPVYMEDQQFINERMRSILVDWLVEVHLKFKLVPETLYLTVNVIDRYLAKTEVSRPKLQLVGVTALLIASKYEEIYPPELRDLVYICDRAYSKNEVRSWN